MHLKTNVFLDPFHFLIIVFALLRYQLSCFLFLSQTTHQSEGRRKRKSCKSFHSRNFQLSWLEKDKSQIGVSFVCTWGRVCSGFLSDRVNQQVYRDVEHPFKGVSFL